MDEEPSVVTRNKYNPFGNWETSASKNVFAGITPKFFSITTLSKES